VVPEEALLERMSTSGGPGGQHANRSASQVELRVAVEDLPLTHRERALIYERLASRLRSDGTIAVTSSSSRSQLANRKSARAQLQRLLEDSLKVDAPRVKTRPSRGARERMRAFKHRRSLRKQTRRGQWQDGDE
jgi:ribosome-associated protein